MFGILEAVAVPQAGVYNTYDDLINSLNERMEKDGYKVVKSRSHKGRHPAPDGSHDMVRCDLVCDRGGRPYVCQATKHKTSTKKTGCPWKAKAVQRKGAGGWVLTIGCDQHNHEPGTPEPPSPEPFDGEDGNDDQEDLGLRVDPETSAAIQVAGVSEAVLKLTGDTFQQFKTEYRKMTQTDRLDLLSSLQLRIAAIYAVQNEDMQRSKRQEAQAQRHQAIGDQRRSSAEAHRRGTKRRRIYPMQPGHEVDGSESPQQQLRQEDQQAQHVQQQRSSQQQASLHHQQGQQQAHLAQQYRQQPQSQSSPQQQQQQQQQRQRTAQQPRFELTRSTELIMPVPGFDHLSYSTRT